jgi:hypothetical protein
LGDREMTKNESCFFHETRKRKTGRVSECEKR